jgi:hypothetical protein
MDFLIRRRQYRVIKAHDKLAACHMAYAPDLVKFLLFLLSVNRLGICHTIGSNLVRQRLTNQALSTSSPYQSGAHDWLADHIFREISRIKPLIF